MKKTLLTGLRPTGKLHIGHYFGMLKNTVKFQEEGQFNLYPEIADIQAMTDNYLNPQKVHDSVRELILDFYAVGMDFDKSKIFIQSLVPEIHEIFVLIANFNTVQNVMRNPTIKTEIEQKKMGEGTPFGFFMYTTHQIADILSVNAHLVPVGLDQVPIVEDMREVVRKFNKAYNTTVLNEPESYVTLSKNVPGIDGNEKMGKSLGNCIYLSDTEEELRLKVKLMKSDDSRKSFEEPGNPENTVTFKYLAAVENESNAQKISNLRKEYLQGGVKDSYVKDLVFEELNTLLADFRIRRAEADRIYPELLAKCKMNSESNRLIAQSVLSKMKSAMLLEY